MDPKKISAIFAFPTSKSLKALRSFLGLYGWYRKFISNFAAITSPIKNLLTQKRKFVFTKAALEAFEELKEKLSQAPVLRSADFSRPLYIHRDASKTGVGGVLVQHSPDGGKCPIAFVSKNSAGPSKTILLPRRNA